ncbi:hypothetical protein ATANTOWER_000416 [Ataeniobius toweri]|uniref:Uncharacterized protein n=1 Tax=Ataeniobius toweri TaxID=208326 RepID=A0ABU7CBB9_9TELE|nr:hypothetical protein [Ataeniobius toweri]
MVWGAGDFSSSLSEDTDSEAKQPQANKEAEKGKTKAAADPASPQKQPEQLPAAVGHSTPARKEQIGAATPCLWGWCLNRATEVALWQVKAHLLSWVHDLRSSRRRTKSPTGRPPVVCRGLL